MKLKSTTEFVLDQNNRIPKDLDLVNNYKCIVKYAKLLKRELRPEYFYCFKKEPKRWNDYLEFPESFDGNKEWYEIYEYQESKEKVLFDGFEIELDNSFETVLSSENHKLIFRENVIWCSNKENTIDIVSTIEDLIDFFDFELNENGVKIIGS